MIQIKYILVSTEDIFNNNEKITLFKISDCYLNETSLYPSKNYLTWENWQYILFPKSVGAVIQGLNDNFYYIINDSEIINENYHNIIFNFTDFPYLPIFHYADINKTNFKDIDLTDVYKQRENVKLDTVLTENETELSENNKQIFKIINEVDVNELNYKINNYIKNCKNAQDIFTILNNIYIITPDESLTIKIRTLMLSTLLCHKYSDCDPEEFLRKISIYIHSNVVTSKFEDWDFKNWKSLINEYNNYLQQIISSILVNEK
ncbi:hypothetical protein J6O48_01930 [bacterium]|nr:hypothetical protein [bacterium]